MRFIERHKTDQQGLLRITTYISLTATELHIFALTFIGSGLIRSKRYNDAHIVHAARYAITRQSGY